MVDDEKKPEEKNKWGFKMPDLSSAIKGVTDAAKAASDKAMTVGKEASSKAAEIAKAAEAKAQEVAKQAQEKMKKDKSDDNKNDNKPSP
ncbi:MAG: hypothetical protein JSS07_08505 [Proteobacteria bacterium]|nr:hypothetical protein [Pseudomonadota bacterium]